MMIENYQNYQIVRLDLETNRQAGGLETAPYALSLSGGLGSAIAAERAIQRYGRENVLLWKCESLRKLSSAMLNIFRQQAKIHTRRRAI